jgi:hypothetical protein
MTATKTTRRRQPTQAAEPLSRPGTATPPPGGPCAQALQPAEAGVVRLWLMTADEAYRLSISYIGPSGTGWRFTKHSDGTAWDVFEENGELRCDCPGWVNSDGRCCEGQGCKHVRFLKAIRQLVDPGL